MRRRKTLDPVQEWKHLQDISFLYRAVAYDQEESYWSKYAHNYDIRRHQGKGIEDEVQMVSDSIDQDMTVLEIGAGTGIFTEKIAKKVKNVTVVEPSSSMIRVLKGNLGKKGISNVEIVQSKWEDADVAEHDVVLACGCLYVFYDIERALEKMLAKARKRLLLTHGINRPGNIYSEAAELLGVEPPSSGPDYLTLYRVLYQMGVYADIHILRSRGSVLYDDIDHAINTWAQRLGLENTKYNVLKEYLEKRLVLLPSGKLSFGDFERLNAVICYSKGDPLFGKR